MNINLHIERLVLDDLVLERHQTLLVKASVEAELSRLLTAADGAKGLTSGRRMASAAAPAIHVTRDGNPTHLGQQIGRAVHQALGDQPRSYNAAQNHHE